MGDNSGILLKILVEHKFFYQFWNLISNNVVAFLHVVFVIVNFVSHVYEMFFST
jgi:hypothetical protein